MIYVDAEKLKKMICDNDYELVDQWNSHDKGMFTIGILQAIDECVIKDEVPKMNRKRMTDEEYENVKIECDNLKKELSLLIKQRKKVKSRIRTVEINIKGNKVPKRLDGYKQELSELNCKYKSMSQEVEYLREKRNKLRRRVEWYERTEEDTSYKNGRSYKMFGKRYCELSQDELREYKRVITKEIRQKKKQQKAN